MARITCKTPSTGKGITVTMVDVTSNFTVIAEAPDFSVPDPSNNYSTRDPLDDSRAIRPGEVFFITPVAAKNKSSNTVWIEVRLVTESNTTIDFGRALVPGNDTVFIPIQGRSLYKRNPSGSIGDRLEIRAQANGVFDIWAAAEEKLSNEHVGVV